ncbi:GYDIA family GHMP kinase [Carboxylicivirga taeanensis]|uniref:GYDIA family GHMP kinase n=1 Tax=Carboxylicivirga taeanensis TaxID=1416875 RepID=UPI003F6E2E48
MVQDSEQSYYAHGKLLISGEYVVLAGAKALAIPLKYGQSLTVTENKKYFLSWTATTPKGNWFEATFNEALEVLESDNLPLANKLGDILLKCKNYRDDITQLLLNRQVTTRLEFDANWGWGSSSTLISLLAQWLGVHPYLLLQDTFGGSGYDIACATASSAVIFELNNDIPKTTPVQFQPDFHENIYFVYTGRKQSSQKAIASFSKSKVSQQDLQRISAITQNMLGCNSLHEFGHLMEEHETIISSIVQLYPIKNEHFEDFKGYIKALGAWGGDFIMVVSEESPDYITNYFAQKNLNTIFKLNEIKR